MRLKLPPKDLWKLEDGITQSLLGTWLSCKQKAHLSYQKGWTSSQVSNAITFGSLFHEALEHYYKTGKYNIEKLLIKQKKEVESERIWTISDEENKVLNEGYLKILIPAYIEHYKKIDAGKKWVLVEEEFKNKWNGLLFRGKYDRVCHFNNEAWIFDTKTKSRIDPEIQSKLEFDLQIMFYHLNYWLTFKKVPNGFVYDQIRRPALRKGSKETMKRFMDRVKNDVDESYFQRVRMPMNKEILTHWVVNEFTPMIVEFKRWALRASPTYKNPSACETRYGTCQFIRGCGTKDFNGLYKKKKVFSELEAI